MFDANKIDELNSVIKKLDNSLSGLEMRLQTSNSDNFLARMSLQLKKALETVARLQEEYKDMGQQLAETHANELKALEEKKKRILAQRELSKQNIEDLRKESELRKFVGEYQNNTKAYDLMQRKIRKAISDDAKAELKMRRDTEKVEREITRAMEKQADAAQRAAQLNNRLNTMGGDINKLNENLLMRRREKADALAKKKQEQDAKKEDQARDNLLSVFGRGQFARADSFFGGIKNMTDTFKRAASVIGMFNAAIMSLIGLIGGLLIAYGITRITDRVKAYGDIRQSGFGTELSNTMVSTGFTGTEIAASKYGTVLTNQQMAEVSTATANQLGGGNIASAELLASIGNVTKGYYASSEAATKYATALMRNNKFAQDLTVQSFDLIEKYGVGSKVSVSRLTETLASNTDLLARSADKTGEALLKAAINSDRLGVSLNSFEGLANRLVDDFESSLMMQAQLQTFLPGMDFSESMYAAQFGTTDQFIDSIRRSLTSSGMGDVSQLPRSLQNKLASSLGMSLTEINNILTGPSTTAAPMATDEVGKFAKSVDTATMNMGLFNGMLQNGVNVLKGLFGQGQGPQWDRTLQNPKFHSGGYVTKSSYPSRIASSAFMNAPRFHSGLMPDEVPAILQTGEAVLSRSQLSGLMDLMRTTVVLRDMGKKVSMIGPTSISSNDIVQKFTSYMGDTLSSTSVNNIQQNNVEGKLDEVISVLKNIQIVVDLDGKKVGRGVVEAYSRGA